MIKKRFLVASHYSEVYAPTFPLLEFLEGNTLGLTYVLHPMINSLVKDRIIKNGKGRRTLIKVPERPTTIKLISDFFYTCSFAIKNLGSFEVFVGVNCLNALSGLMIKLFFKRKSIVIFYSADYSRRRFPNFLNNLYLLFDLIAAKFSDYVWVVTTRAEEVRIKQGIKKQKIILVPNGVHLEKIDKEVKKDKNILFYVGNLTETKGVQHILQALKGLKKYQLVVIGDGPFKEELVVLAEKLGIKRRVSFLGKMTNEEVLKKISKYGIGLAPYLELEDYIHYGDSVKIKEYLASGCPVIMSNVTWIAEEIRKNGCGLVVKDFVRGFKNAVARVENNFEQMSRKAINYSLSFDWQEIYKNALQKSQL